MLRVSLVSVLVYPDAKLVLLLAVDPGKWGMTTHSPRDNVKEGGGRTEKFKSPI